MDPMQRPEGQQRRSRSVEDVLLTIAKALGQKAIVPPAPVEADAEAEAAEAPVEATAGEEVVESVETEAAVAYPLPDLDSDGFQSYVKAFWLSNLLTSPEQGKPQDSFGSNV